MAEQTFWNVQTGTGKSCFGGREEWEGGRCGRRRIAAAAAVGKDATGAQGHVPALSVCVCVHGPRPRPIATWDNRPSVCVYVCIVCRGVFLSVLGLISFFFLRSRYAFGFCSVPPPLPYALSHLFCFASFFTILTSLPSPFPSCRRVYQPRGKLVPVLTFWFFPPGYPNEEHLIFLEG